MAFDGGDSNDAGTASDPSELRAVDPAVICQALAPFLVDGRRERIDATINARLGGLTLVIENLHDPHNGAAVLRSAEAFGIQTVHVVEAAEKFRFSSVVTQGCEKWLDVERHPTFAAARARLHAAGFVLYAAVPDAPRALDELDFSRRAAVLVGNEHAGLSDVAIAGADERFSIPMLGMTRSLNLSVAAALVASRGAAARRRALAAASRMGQGDDSDESGAPGRLDDANEFTVRGRTGDLDGAARLRLRARFYVASVRGAAQIVHRYVAESVPPTGRRGQGA